MKNLTLLSLLLIAELCYGQTNYYTFNTNDSLYNEKQVQELFKAALKSIPNQYILEPTIYHRIIKSDSIINYTAFHAEKTVSTNNESRFEFTFKQDSVFLLLNKKLPGFILKDVKDNEYSSKQLIGKPALLNYWAIYCKPCIAEMPELNGLKEKYGDKMNFIALTENTCQDDNLIGFLEKHPFNFHIIQNAEGYKKALKINAIPRNIFVDKEGYVRYIQANFPYTAYDSQKGIKEYDNKNYFVRIIERLIKE